MISAVTMEYQGVVGVMGPAVAQSRADLGSNGPANGYYPEYGVGGPNGLSVFGRTTWSDGSGDGGLDTGWVPVQLVVIPSHIDWTVYGGASGSLSLGNTNSGSIFGVAIVAATQAHATVQWSDINVTFSSGGTTTDAYSPPGVGLSVDTSATDDDHMVAEDVLSVTTDTANNDSVCVNGLVRMSTASDPSDLGPLDLFSDIVVFAGTNQ